MLKQTKILGVKITTSREEEILEFIIKKLDKPKGKRGKVVIFTPNSEQLSAAHSDNSLRDILNKADISLPDGAGVVAASKLSGNSIEARVTGVDFMQRLLVSISNAHTGVSKRPVVTGYFGGQKGVAVRTFECLQKIAPNITLGYASDGFDKEEMIHSDIDILFVALGFPKQEKWILEHKDEVPASVIMAVGGAFDLISGRLPRAPRLVRQVGFEWLFRLFLEPSRFWRQLRIWHFGALIFLEALSSPLKKIKD